MLDVVPAALLDAMSDGVYVVDRSRVITYWNVAATRLTGYRDHEVIGRHCGDGLLNHVDSTGRPLCGDRCPLLATLDDGLTRSCRVFVHHAAGHMAPVHVTASVLRDGDGVIVGAVEVFRDDAEMLAITERLVDAQTQAATDPLTGLGNRRALAQIAAERFAEWQSDGQPFGMMLIDIDAFKDINDQWGHDAGDDALRAIARTLRTGVVPGDVVFRLGGDEFCVITGPASVQRLVELAHRLRGLVAQSHPMGRIGDAATVTVSIGAALVTDADDRASLQLRADRHLLRAKQQGKNRADIAEQPTLSVPVVAEPNAAEVDGAEPNAAEPNSGESNVGDSSAGV